MGENFNLDKTGLLHTTLEKMPSQSLPLVALNVAYLVALWQITTSIGFKDYSEVRAGVILISLALVYLLTMIVLLWMDNTSRVNGPQIIYEKGKSKIVCPYWTEYVDQEEPQIEITEDGVASIDGYRAYRFLIHIFKHQRCENFYALDLAFYRWYEVVEEDSVFNVSDTLLTAIGEMCRQQNCKEFRRILCVSEKELFDTRYSSIGVLKKIQEEEAALTEQYSVVMQTSVCVFNGKGPHQRNGIKFADNRIRELVSGLHDFAMFTGETNIAIVESGLTDPSIFIPISKSRFQIINNPNALANMKRGFVEILPQAYALSKIISILEQQSTATDEGI
jgi:hypothetical protein